MGLFDSIRQKKEIEQLKKALQASPTPGNYVALVNKYCEFADEQSALSVAQSGINEFPDSDAVFNAYYKLKKNKAQEEIETLRKIIEERPAPSAFAQIAEIYKDLRDEESAMRYCRQAIEKFPNFDSPYLVIGELRLRRFYKDPLVKDAQKAIENLEKACELNNKNYKALLLLAKLYLQIGAVSKARQRMKNILLFAPEDENVQKMMDILNKMEKPLHEDLDILLQTVETQRKLHYELEESSGARTMEQPAPEVFQTSLDKLKAVKGASCALICDEDGNLITHYALDGVDVNTYYEVASMIYQSVQESSRQMDIGRCQRVQVEGGFGTMHIIYSDGFVYIAFASEEQKQVLRELQKIIAELQIK